MKITKKGVELCGKLRKFKRTPKRQLMKYQEEVEDLLDSYQPVIDEAQDIEDELNQIEEEIMDINEVISILRTKDTTEEEYQKMLSLIEDRKELRKERREIANRLREFTNVNLKKFKGIDDEIPRKLGQLASQLVEITEEEFLENYTDDDELMVRNLALFKQMADAGNTETQMEEIWKEMINEQIKSRMGINPTEG